MLLVFGSKDFQPHYPHPRQGCAIMLHERPCKPPQTEADGPRFDMYITYAIIYTRYIHTRKKCDEESYVYMCIYVFDL